MWLLNVFLLERTLKQELQKWQNRPRGIWLSCPPPTPGCPAYPPQPSSSPPTPPSHHQPPSSPPHPPPSSPTSRGLEGLQSLPPLLEGPVGQPLECLQTGLAFSPLQVQRWWQLPNYSQVKQIMIYLACITRLWCSGCLHPDRTKRNVKKKLRTKKKQKKYIKN